MKQGDPVDLIWNDENIVNKEYYAEWLNRLRDDEGMMMWSTIPRDSCFVFNETINRMEEQQDEVDKGQRATSEWSCILVRLSYLDSPFIPQRQKDLALEQMGDRDTLVRIYGERSTRLISVYQDFNPSFHCAVYNDSRDDKVSAALIKNNMVPPADWTREIVIDPGTQKPFLLMCAVPPPDLWDHEEPYFVVYREIAVRRMSPDDMAKEVMRTDNDYQFERFIIDGRMGRQTPPGFVDTVDYQYTKAFRKVGLTSRQTGTGFIYGDDDFSRRSKSVIYAMRSRPCGRPQLRIVTQTCPTLVKQLLSNVRKTTPDGEPKEEAADNQPDDCRVSLEYWISRKPTWVLSEVEKVEPVNPVYQAYLEMRRKHKEADERNKPASGTFKIGVP